MTYTIYGFNSEVSKILLSKTTTDSEIVKCLVVSEYEKMGYWVKVVEEN